MKKDNVIKFLDVTDYHERGLSLLDDGDLLAAMGCLALAYEEHPEDDILAADYANVLYAAGRYDESIRVLMMVRHYHPSPVPDVHFALACNHFEQENYAMAEMFLDDFVQWGDDPEYADAIQEMLRCCREERRRFSTSDTAREWLMQSYDRHMAGDDAAALTLVRQAVQAHPENLPLRHQLIGLLLTNQCYGEANEVAEKTVKIKPDDIQTLCLLTHMAHLLKSAKRNALIKKTCVAAQAPAVSEISRMLVVCMLMEVESPQEGYRFARRCELQKSGNPAILHRLACCAVAAGEHDQAAAHWQQIRTVEPLDIQANIFLQSLNKGTLRGMPDMEYKVPEPVQDQLVSEICGELTPQGEASAHWREVQAFRARVCWAFNHAKGANFEALLEFLGEQGDVRAVAAMQDFLARGHEEKRMLAVLGELYNLGCRDSYAVLRQDGTWATMHRKKSIGRKEGRGARYFTARRFVCHAAAMRWGEEGEEKAGELFANLLRKLSWPLPRIEKPDALAAGVLAAVAVLTGDWEMFRHLTADKPEVDAWCKKTLQMASKSLQLIGN